MSAAAQRLAELRVALMFLTRLPVPPARGPRPSIAEAGWAFVPCGALIGLLAGLAYAAGAALGLPALLCALLAIAASVLVTGALHEDGLADFADGLGGGKDRVRKLEIMRDSAIGSYGVLALILVIGARAIAIGELDCLLSVIAALVALSAASRFAMLLGLEMLPPARADGLGREAGRPGRKQIVAAVILTALAMTPLGAKGAIVFAGVLIAAAIPAVLAWRQIGGQTGDVLGAVQQISEIGGWFVLLGVGSGD